MENLNLWLFLSISILVLISPGPNIIYVITQGMMRGRKATFKAVAGASTGDMVQSASGIFRIGGFVTGIIAGISYC